MIEVFFDEIETQLIKEISAAKKSIKIAVAWFTNKRLFDIVLEQCRNKILVEVIIINDSINIKRVGLGIDFNELIKEDGHLYFGDFYHLMHHKFCIIDGEVLINGSYNWTYWAETKNEENITVIKNEKEVIGRFEIEFNKLIKDNFLIPKIDETTRIISDKDNFFNLNRIKVNEYIESAIVFRKKGENKMASKLVEEVYKLDSELATKISENNEVFKSTIKRIKETSYKEYCAEAKNMLKEKLFDEVIHIVVICKKQFPDKLSICLYCADAKTWIE